MNNGPKLQAPVKFLWSAYLLDSISAITSRSKDCPLIEEKNLLSLRLRKVPHNIPDERLLSGSTALTTAAAASQDRPE